MPHEPITTTTIPAPPGLLSVVLQLGVGLVAFTVLFVLPPCATSLSLDLGALAGLGVWAGLALIRYVRWSRCQRDSPILLPRVASPPARVAGDRDEAE